MNKQMTLFVVGILILAVLCGCAAQDAGINSPSGATMEMGATYQPKSPPDIQDFEAARADLALLLKSRKGPLNIEFGDRYHAQHGPRGLIWKDEWQELNRGANSDLAQFSYDASHRLVGLIVRNIVVQEDSFLALYPSVSVPFSGFYESPLSVKAIGAPDYSYVVEVPKWITFKFARRDLAVAQRFADDLFFMQQWEKKAREKQLALFESKAAEYRALNVKPPVGEEQRKYIVQANAMSQHKEYADAIDLYRKAMEITPVSYPGAYFNMALLSAQIGRFSSAITYMKQYLMLEPDAEDARSAQDKIYEWDLMMKR